MHEQIHYLVHTLGTGRSATVRFTHSPTFDQQRNTNTVDIQLSNQNIAQQWLVLTQICKLLTQHSHTDVNLLALSQHLAPSWTYLFLVTTSPTQRFKPIYKGHFSVTFRNQYGACGLVG